VPTDVIASLHCRFTSPNHYQLVTAWLWAAAGVAVREDMAMALTVQVMPRFLTDLQLSFLIAADDSFLTLTHAHAHTQSSNKTSPKKKKSRA